MLDLLLSKCASLAHFSGIVAGIESFASALKNSFAGPLEHEVAEAISVLLSNSLKTASPPANVPVNPSNVPLNQVNTPPTAQ